MTTGLLAQNGPSPRSEAETQSAVLSETNGDCPGVSPFNEDASYFIAVPRLSIF